MGFSENFIWGASTSAYQIEGATTVDGRGLSIWESFEKIPGAVANGHTGEIACDHYNRYENDIALMKQIGLQAYRFSFSWPRILPSGSGKIEAKGLDFYDRLIDKLLEVEIEPVATLYHWDLPQALQDFGGWASREILEPFSEYASLIAKHFGDRVTRFTPINEPWVVSWLGYGSGVLAPGIADTSQAIAAAHHTVVAHNRALLAIKSERPNAKVGPVFNQLNPDIDDWSDPSQLQAAKIYDEFQNKFWMDSTFKGFYSDTIWQMYGDDLSAVVHEGDLEVVSNDWLGINYYFNTRIGHQVLPEHKTVNGFISQFGGGYTEGAAVGLTTDMGWPITPYGIGDILVRWTREYANEVPQMFITENGAAYSDGPDDQGKINDDRRIEYLKAHLIEIERAISQGANVGGYFHWSLMDNFEWALGYEKRFGLIHVDYQNLQRTLKNSAYFYRDVIQSNGTNLKSV